MRCRHPRTGLVALLLLWSVACTTAEPAPAPSTPTETPTTSSPSPSPPGSPSPSATAARPAPVVLDEVARHPSGVTMHLEALARRRGGLALTVRVVNGATQEAVVAAEPSWVTLVDDTGAALELVPPEANPNLSIAPGDELAGELVFSGALGADASTVSVRFNWVDGEAWNDDEDVAGIVSFAFDDLPLAPDATETAGTDDSREEVAVEVRQEHPGGVVLEVDRVVTVDDAVLLAVRVVNTHASEPAQLAVQPDLTWLEDDLGNRYRFRPPDDNPQLVVGPGEELVGDVAFVGPLEAGASELTLRTNHRRSGSPLNEDRPVPSSASLVVTGLPVP